MKRIVSLLLAILLLCFSISMVACDSSSDRETIDTEPEDTQHTHTFADATCKVPKTCACGATDGEPLNAHTFENGVCKVCEKTLLQEIRSIIYDTQKGTFTEGFSVETESGSTYSPDVTSIFATIAVDIPNSETDWYGITITLTQETILSGVYEWSFTRNIYVEESHRYFVSKLVGTVPAAEFTGASSLTVTDNVGHVNGDPFSTEEIPEYVSIAADLLDGLIKAKLVPLFTLNESNLTIADLGFNQYK